MPNHRCQINFERFISAYVRKNELKALTYDLLFAVFVKKHGACLNSRNLLLFK